MGDVTKKRKHEHIAQCVTEEVECEHKTSWLEYVELLHHAIPPVPDSRVDTTVDFLGHTLHAPFIIGSMVGGTDESREINRILAGVAQEHGIGLALGSQRLMLEDPCCLETYYVRDIAPDILLLGNIGICQALGMSTKSIADLAESIGADGICVHLNISQEFFQEEGDKVYHGMLETIRCLADGLGERLIVKETGCGISRETAMLLRRLGVRTVDVSGSGGTSWIRVESLRRKTPWMTETPMRDWGIPTAASLLECRGVPIRLIGSGGIRSGLELAKAIALGADIGSAALPLLRACVHGGYSEACNWVHALLHELRAVMVLSGCRHTRELQQARKVFTGPLWDWVAQTGTEYG